MAPCGPAPQMVSNEMSRSRPVAVRIASSLRTTSISVRPASGAVASSFSKAYRYTGAAITSDLAWLFGAGFAPLAALLLSTNFGLISAGAYLLSGAVCTVIALWYSDRLATGTRDRQK